MTKEEAKEVFLNRGFINGLFDGDKWRESVVVISKWLEQEPCEDAISRQAVLEQINCWIGSGEYKYTNATYYLIRRMQELPPVTPQSKMGHWITWKEAGNDIPSETRFECSVCHDAAQTLCNGLDLLSPYCPNCGAKMAESEG